jgi:hypothetical protein
MRSQERAGPGLPWQALDAALEPSVHLALVRDDHGPVFLASITGTAQPAEVMDWLSTWSDAELQEVARCGWMRKGQAWVNPDPAVRLSRLKQCQGSGRLRFWAHLGDPSPPAALTTACTLSCITDHMQSSLRSWGVLRTCTA